MEEGVVVATTEVVEVRTGVVVAGVPATAPLVLPRRSLTTLTPAPAMQ